MSDTVSDGRAGEAADGLRAPIMPGFGAAMFDPQLIALVTYLRSRFSTRPAWSDIAAELREARETALAANISPATSVVSDSKSSATASPRGQPW